MIFLILILAFFLRLVNLNQSLWLDEAVQAITAQNSLGYIFQEITGDFHPPLYFFLMHFWVRIFGSSEISLRMPSVLFGIGTVYFVYKIVMVMHNGNKKAAILAAVLLATAPFHIYYSQEARMYSMTTFFATFSMFYFIKLFLIDKTDRKISSKFKVQSSKLQLKIKSFDYLLYFLTTLLMIYSDYYGFLVLLAQIIFLLNIKKYKFLILNSLFIILCYLPWLPMLITQIKTGMLATQLLPGWVKLVNVSFLKAIPLTLVKFLIGRITIFDKRIYGLVSLGILGLLGGLGRLSWVRRKKVDIIILLWFFVPLIVSWIASIFVPNYQPFRLLLILPAFYLLITEGIERINRKELRLILSGIFLTINLISLSVYFTNPYFQREDWRGLVLYLKQQNNPKIILPSSASGWPIAYYDSEKKINVTSGITGVGQINDSVKFEDRKVDELFYIRYLVPVFDPQERILSSLGKEGYTKVEEISFNQIFMVKYEKR